MGRWIILQLYRETYINKKLLKKKKNQIKQIFHRKLQIIIIIINWICWAGLCAPRSQHKKRIYTHLRLETREGDSSINAFPYLV